MCACSQKGSKILFLSAQVSLYPLRQPRLSPAIDEALDTLKVHGLDITPGAMSTLMAGDDEALFAGLKEVFRRTAEQGELVMVVTMSNACPVARRPQGKD